MLLDRLDPGEHTMLYGPGGIGKGSLAAWWIAQLSLTGRQVLILDYENHGGEWGRRIEGLGGDMDSVRWIAPYAVGLGPLWDIAEDVRALMADQPDPYLVIDSAGVAVAGKPEESETARRYFGALQRIGVPSLTLAHVTKLHDARYPFGSAYWHNLSRVTWSMMPKGEDVLLVCQKANNYQKPSAATVEMTWHEGTLREVHERKAVVVLTDRIIEALTDGPMAVADIAGTLNDGLPTGEHTSAATIRKALQRELKRGQGSRVTVQEDGQWCLKEALSRCHAGVPCISAMKVPRLSTKGATRGGSRCHVAHTPL
jgi:AAA domain